jgi:pyruvyl transferase EpsO
MLENDTFNHEMERLKAEHDTLANLIPPGTPVAYIDYPIRHNIGDLLIWLGGEAFLSKRKIPVIYRCNSINVPRRLPKLPPDTVILCHGGGNFGDLYPEYQALRERIVQQLPHHRIIFLPQTLFYQNPENLKVSARILNAHADLHIFVRDMNSAALARESFSAPVYLVPDMAHHLWPLLYLRTKDWTPSGTLFHIRTDIERSNIPDKLRKHESEFRDWLDMVTLLDRALIYRVLPATNVVDRNMRNVLPMELIYYRFNQYLCHRAANLFADFDTVVTSRLHGHILACLLRRRSVLLDNSYGKNSSYFRTWTYRLETTELVTNGPS